MSPGLRQNRPLTGLAVAGLACALAAAGCYEDLHVVGEEPAAYAWAAVYAEDAAARTIAVGAPPAREQLWSRPYRGDPVAIGGDLHVALDSLRGFVVLVAEPDGGSEVEDFVTVPGITAVAVAGYRTVVVDNLGEAVTLALNGAGGVTEVARRAATPPAPPDPLAPPPPGTRETDGSAAPRRVGSDYFECPSPDRGGRFLGWRLLRASPLQSPSLCRYR